MRPVVACACGGRAVCYAPEPLCLLCATDYYTALVQIGAELSRARVRAEVARETAQAAALTTVNRRRSCLRCSELRGTGHGTLCPSCLLKARQHALKGKEA